MQGEIVVVLELITNLTQSLSKQKNKKQTSLIYVMTTNNG